jgi:hypothetical protein
MFETLKVQSEIIFSFFFCRKKKETKKTHHESQLQIFFSHKSTHFLAKKFAVRAFRGRQPHVL